MGRRNTVFLAALLAAVVATGCEDPYEPPAERDAATTESSRATPPEPPADGELPGTVPEELQQPEPRRFPTAGRTPRQTLARAAALYGNWTSTTAAAQFRRIAALSVGEARAQLRESAAQSGTDPQQAGATSRSSVVAIDVQGRGSQRRAAVVTRERVQAKGLPDEDAQYRVTLATVERRGGRWVISRWAPQS